MPALVMTLFIFLIFFIGKGWAFNQSGPGSSQGGSIRVVRDFNGHVYMTNLRFRVPAARKEDKVFPKPYESFGLPEPAEKFGQKEMKKESSIGPEGLHCETSVLSAREEAVEPQIQEASRRTGLSANLIRAMVKAESDFDPMTISSKGAKGLMQLMDVTAGEMMVANVFDPLENILGGVGYFKKLLERYGGVIELALAAYNAGPTNVDRHKGIPPFDETRNYIRKVKRFWRDYRKQ